MKSKKMSHHKVPNSYDKLNERVVWLFPKENTLVSTNKELYSNTSIAVNPPSVNPSLTSKHMNSLNREVSEASTVLFPSFKSPSSHKTPTAIQLVVVNVSSAEQFACINVPMSHDQGMEKSTKPIIKSLTLLYNNN